MFNFLKGNLSTFIKVKYQNRDAFSNADPPNNFIKSFFSRNIKPCQLIFTYSKLTLKTPEWSQSGRSGVFIVKFEHISHFFLQTVEKGMKYVQI